MSSSLTYKSVSFRGFSLNFIFIKILNEDKDEGNGSELESTVDDDEEDLMCEMEDVEARTQQNVEGDVSFLSFALRTPRSGSERIYG